MSADFRDRLIAFSEKSIISSSKCSNEESTKMFLVLPFLNLLGYDPSNPHEVYPEHHADFSEKYKNKVDYALLRDDQAIIAVECKCAGAAMKDDRGQLKSYFNAAKSVKMGVLTDGLIWEFYADSDEPNLMDDSAFLTIDLRQIAKGKLDDSSFEALRSLQKQHFDPQNIGAKAREKHIHNSVIREIASQYTNPTDEFCRNLLKAAGLKHVSQKALTDYRPTIQSAFREFINQQILLRLDITDKPPERILPPVETPPLPLTSEQKGDSKIVTTENELNVFNWVQKRLAFLVKDDRLFAAIDGINYRDYQGKFVVYYKQERKGRLFEYIEPKAGSKDTTHRFIFPEDIEIPDREVVTDKWTDLDGPLLTTFRARVGGAA